MTFKYAQNLRKLLFEYVFDPGVILSEVLGILEGHSVKLSLSIAVEDSYSISIGRTAMPLYSPPRARFWEIALRQESTIRNSPMNDLSRRRRDLPHRQGTPAYPLSQRFRRPVVR